MYENRNSESCMNNCFFFKNDNKSSQNPYATPQWMLYLYEISHFLAFLCPALTFYIFCLPDQVP